MSPDNVDVLSGKLRLVLWFIGLGVPLLGALTMFQIGLTVNLGARLETRVAGIEGQMATHSKRDDRQDDKIDKNREELFLLKAKVGK